VEARKKSVYKKFKKCVHGKPFTLGYCREAVTDFCNICVLAKRKKYRWHETEGETDKAVSVAV